MTIGKQYVALYTETSDDAVYFDLSQSEHSLIRSRPDGMPQTLELCHEALAQAAFDLHARHSHLSPHRWGFEEVDGIPRGLQTFGIGGAGDTCAVVVFEQLLAAHPTPTRSTVDSADDVHHPI